MTKTLVNALLSLSKESRRIGNGEFLFQQGQSPEYLLLVNSGSFEVFSKDQNWHTQESADSLNTRKLWGLREIMTNKEFNLSAKALDDVHCWAISTADLRSKLSDDPGFRLELMGHLAHEIQRVAGGFE